MTKLRACIILLSCTANAIVSQAQITFTTLASFDMTDGDRPYSSLVQGFDGNFYGTTMFGGANDTGTVFRISADGQLTELHSFQKSEGYYSYGGLVQADDGSFYGTTSDGGVNNYGTVFRVAPGGKLKPLYSFCSQPSCADGSVSYAGLMQATDGNFYGTTYEGGANNYGTVFKITKGGDLSTIYNFCSAPGCADGSGPAAGLVQATDGNLYGTTQGGGTGGNGGTVFRISFGGELTTLYSFCSQPNCADGEDPTAALMQANNGNFYGTTYSGGASNENRGTVFEITRAGNLTTLYSFCTRPSCDDGASPLAPLTQATNGDLFGTTQEGGVDGSGTIFKVNAKGMVTTQYSFCSQPSCSDGGVPYAGLIQATDGNIYGAAYTGGAYSDGTIFGVSVGLGPFVETQADSGNVGAHVIILGNNLTGSSAVGFNGTPATLTVVSETEITTVVPAGATTGFLTVTTPGGILTSNKVFRIVP